MLIVENDTKGVVRTNEGGGEVFVRLTVMFCAVPAQGLGATQVTMMVALVVPEGSVSALAFRATLIGLPGVETVVPLPGVTVNHAAELLTV